MSYDQKGRPGGAQGTSEDEETRKGSVRAARKRLQAAQMRTQLPDTSKIIGLPQRPNQLTSQQPPRSRADEQPQKSPSSKSSKPKTITPPPRWPLPNDAAANSGLSRMIPPRSPKMLRSPQQEGRPLSDEYPIQQLSPSYSQPKSTNLLQPTSSYYVQSSPVEDMFSPSMSRSSRPLTTSSAASEASSLGSIPDFPVPQPPMPSIPQTRRMSSLGPPPSSRRGPSSYYTQMSYVSPIAEESERSSSALRSRHGSYASSNVFPNHHDDFYGNDDLFSDDDSTITSERGTISPEDQDDRRGLVQQSPALVRQASLGRRTKPSLMTIKSVDSLGDRKGTAKSKPDGMRSDAAAYETSGGPSSSVSTTPLRNVQLAGSLSGFELPDQPPQEEAHAANTLADRAGMRRPPRLDMDAVRDAEARGSLTSLPDLIRRATRLAANLDRGKTASRLGLDFWETGAPGPKDIRQSGLSDMLAAFPRPGHDTPNSRPSRWASPRSESRAGATESALSNEKPKRRRRCCGMPMWTFITLLIVLLFIIAAAVVIPVVLVVIPNQNNNIGAVQQGQGNNGNGNNNSGNGDGGGGNSLTSNRPAPTLAPGVNQCDSVITCQNGGIPILNSDRTCNCVCINGFTGSTCTTNDATGCTTTSVNGAADNATMGTGISRLLGNTAADFSVPLNSMRVLSLFSELSLSCAAQNALITFNGLASRSEKQTSHSVDVEDTSEPWRSLPFGHNSQPGQALDREVKRQAIGAPGAPAGAAQPSATPTPTQPVSSNVKALDFARVGVLFTLQETGELNVAAKAQESIQSFLTSNRNGNAGSSNLNLGPFKMDLVQLTLVFNNGTTIRASSP
ncbi:hypothetical protein BDU57DRAFT_320898 [Ampelomyces quisqualis]|uniref:EGF-like domain-containing protein n=1 Tax=Ampelomyces quisqualis TaxID=50730 RepID=A0A6A5QEI6_AMPQU|nr:hypothetical protein BDU57DRAFT_320898 [Ampelomyces quisqualis]